MDKDYAAYQRKMVDTARIMDTLSLTGEQFKAEVVNYFANAEEDKFSPLAQRVKHEIGQTTSAPGEDEDEEEEKR